MYGSSIYVLFELYNSKLSKKIGIIFSEYWENIINAFLIYPVSGEIWCNIFLGQYFFQIYSR